MQLSFRTLTVRAQQAQQDTNMTSCRSLQLAPYLSQQPTWPQHGQVIMAQYDEQGIYVYQAYNPAIGHYAVQHGHFGGDLVLAVCHG